MTGGHSRLGANDRGSFSRWVTSSGLRHRYKVRPNEARAFCGVSKLAVQAAELASFVRRSSSDVTRVHAFSDHASVHRAALPGKC